MGTKGKRKVRVTIEAPPGAEVYIAGTFNQWNVNAKQLREQAPGGLYAAALMLPRGRHEYKYVVNGEWQIDTANPRFALNDIGTLNSVLQVT